MWNRPEIKNWLVTYDDALLILYGKAVHFLNKIVMSQVSWERRKDGKSAFVTSTRSMLNGNT